MKYYIGVSEFGKINNADIEISNFVVFVGNNNSGKTFLMQLLYGVLDSINDFNYHNKSYQFEIGKNTIIDSKWFEDFETKLNIYLKKNKDEIVYNIFKKVIPIKKLYFRFEDYNSEVEIRIHNDKSEELVQIKDNVDNLTQKNSVTVEFNYSESFDSEKIDKITIHGITEIEKFIYNMIFKTIKSSIFNFNFRFNNKSSQIYIPASRTGLSLLYRYYFSEEDKNYKPIIEINDKKINEMKDNELGLSQPVYDFLQFLLRYNKKEKIEDKKLTSLIKFIEKNLMEGKLSIDEDETLYIPSSNKIKVPLYLSSSMVNELVPIMKVLTGYNFYDYIFYDEIELCLHPEKQQELARMLIRLNNYGKKLIISTHSDTMATKINNLLLLSFANVSHSKSEINNKLEKLNLTKDDLLKNKNIHVYQFINQADGTSNVEELEFRKTPYIGYDFSLFEDNVQKLYDESLIITE